MHPQFWYLKRSIKYDWIWCKPCIYQSDTEESQFRDTHHWQGRGSSNTENRISESALTGVIPFYILIFDAAKHFDPRLILIFPYWIFISVARYAVITLTLYKERSWNKCVTSLFISYQSNPVSPSRVWIWIFNSAHGVLKEERELNF